MTIPRLERVEELFLAAFELPTERRGSFLERECAGDDELRAEIEDLLAADGCPSVDFLDPGWDGWMGVIRTLDGALGPTGAGSDSDYFSVHEQQPALLAGSRLSQYEIIRFVGRGGMGEVYLARDLRLGRLVAIKLLTSRRAGLSKRFQAEAYATARCNHESIVVIHEISEHGGWPYMVLEYLEGQTLRELLHQAAAGKGGASASGALSPSRAVELMIPVVRALVYAHERGIVHRDLKPENIMQTRGGAIKVLDFGVAKLMSVVDDGETFDEQPPGAWQPAQAMSSTLIGTLPYMSPEQMSVATIDHRTDIWAVGIMLFELVSGRHPVTCESTRDFMRRIGDVSVPMPSVSEHVGGVGALGAVIERCLIKDPELRTATARELLAELEGLVAGRHAEVSEAGNPFAGLAPFQEADAGRFFGRSAEIRRIVAQLRSQPLVTVVGPSGTGKSSLIRAGVIPALRSSGEGWDACILRPGRSPMAALARALANLRSRSSAAIPVPEVDADHPPSSPEGGRLVDHLLGEPGYLGAQLRGRAISRLRRFVLVIDQFEELYTLGAPPEEVAAFLACLAGVADDASSPLRVILSLRSDFLDLLAEDRHLAAEVTRGLVLLPPMGREALREALTRPVADLGFQFESPVLIERMVDALDATRGALPLLQFTAAALWERHDAGRRMLTVASYEQLGGVAGALARHADTVLANTPPRRRALTRAVIERLVTPERTRALVSMSDLHALDTEDPDAVEIVVQELAAMRLVVIEPGASGDGSTVELVHESLIECWPTLARWLDENQKDALYLARLRAAAQEWELHGRDEGLLWRGTPAREAEFWSARYRGSMPERERAYLREVLARAARFRRLQVVLMAVMALLLVWAEVALIQVAQARHEAQQQTELARKEAAAGARALEEALAARRAAEEAQRWASDRAREREQALQAAEESMLAAERARRDAEMARAR